MAETVEDLGKFVILSIVCWAKGVIGKHFSVLDPADLSIALRTPPAWPAKDGNEIVLGDSVIFGCTIDPFLKIGYRAGRLPHDVAFAHKNQ